MKNKKNHKRNVVQIVLLWIAVLAVAFVPRFVKEPAEQTECKFLRVVDGDTIEVQYGQEAVMVRLIGVDAPESVHPQEDQNSQFGEMAGMYLEEVLSGITYVYLEFDKEKYDSYNRLLAYVYTDDKKAFEESINYRLVDEGYAVNAEYPPNVKYANELKRGCSNARKQQRGLWSFEEIRSTWENTIL